MTRYLLVLALGYALGRLHRHDRVAASTDDTSPDPYDDVLLTDEEAHVVHAWQRQHTDRSHGYVPEPSTERAS